MSMLDELLSKYRKNGVMLDTNLLVMYLIGLYDRELVPNFKRTEKYSTDQFDFLHYYVGEFSKLIVTPHVLAETWNFIEKLPQSDFNAFLDKVLPNIDLFEEEHINKSILIKAEGFNLIGITDMAVIKAAKATSCLVITDDLRAYKQFYDNGVDSINMNHLLPI
ncbi:PIN domain-containing protein [Vibrio diabolicus]|uniref:PIN domain-containing protein n=1 Tax=Vibrio diabolicus TaxID=50719 RepID=UPI00211B186C|nr:PIN domain-containing protein [Vibrio diabolicus]MCG9229893.1 PIN domain-containing protein [Vibrio diabolicus]MCG9572623.1 PIN domain-containing protein [Vibrio diabolicus]MCG9593983.1 PIN domain-containing protein [Vibrio diabolicus]